MVKKKQCKASVYDMIMYERSVGKGGGIPQIRKRIINMERKERKLFEEIVIMHKHNWEIFGTDNKKKWEKAKGKKYLKSWRL